MPYELFILGARPERRKYPRESRKEHLLERFEEAFGRILAGEAKAHGTKIVP